MSNNPCKECGRKGCGSYHDECEKYLEWKEQRNLILDRKIKKNDLDYDFFAQTQNRLAKKRRKR